MLVRSPSFYLYAFVLTLVPVRFTWAQTPLSSDPRGLPNPVYSQATFTPKGSNRMYVIGGVNKTVVKADGPGESQVAVFDYGGSETVWMQYPGVTYRPTVGIVAVAIDHRALLTFGGVSYWPERYIEDTPISWFDSSTGAIVPLATYPPPGSPSGPRFRWGHSAAYIPEQNAVYVYGGDAAANTSLTDLWRLDLTTSDWFHILPSNASLVHPVGVGTSMVTIGKWLVICFGAASGNGGAVNTCSLFDTTAGPNGAWVAPIIVGPQGFPPPRSASRMVVYGNNQVLAFGGGTFDVANDYTYDDAWTFDANALPTITWKQLRPAAEPRLQPKPRRDFSMQTHSSLVSRILIWGGHNKKEDLPWDNRIYVLDAAQEPPFWIDYQPNITRPKDPGTSNSSTTIAIGPIVGGIVAGLIIAIAILTAVLLHKRKRSAKHQSVRPDVESMCVDHGSVSMLTNEQSLVVPEVSVGPLSPPPPYEEMNRFGCCKVPFNSREADEMTLAVGDIVAITQGYSDGWGCGINLRTKQSGAFPLAATETVEGASFSRRAIRSAGDDLSAASLLEWGAISKPTYLRLRDLERRQQRIGDEEQGGSMSRTGRGDGYFDHVPRRVRGEEEERERV